MDTITITDGLILTVVAMLVVFLVLASIWGLVELVAKFMPTSTKPTTEIPVTALSTNNTVENPKHKKVAEIIALVLASEDKPDKKFEIVESKRIK